MPDTRKYLMERFSLFLTENYQLYQKQHIPDENIIDSLDTFITYLIDHRIIETSTIKRYTILKEYSKIIDNSKHKTEAVNTLSERFNISERTVWNIIKDHKDRFELKN